MNFFNREDASGVCMTMHITKGRLMTGETRVHAYAAHFYAYFPCFAPGLNLQEKILKEASILTH